MGPERLPRVRRLGVGDFPEHATAVPAVPPGHGPRQLVVLAAVVAVLGLVAVVGALAVWLGVDDVRSAEVGAFALGGAATAALAVRTGLRYRRIQHPAPPVPYLVGRLVRSGNGSVTLLDEVTGEETCIVLLPAGDQRGLPVGLNVDLWASRTSRLSGRPRGPWVMATGNGVHAMTHAWVWTAPRSR